MHAVAVPREPNPTRLGDPEHFRRTCRSHAERTVQCFVQVEGFCVPADGVWMVNGLWAPPGSERTLIEGDKVTFYPTVRHPDCTDPHLEGARLQRAERAPLVDPQTARPLERQLRLRVVR